MRYNEPTIIRMETTHTNVSSETMHYDTMFSNIETIRNITVKREATSMTSLIETGSATIPKKYHETLGKILFTEEMIAKRITEMAAEISKDYDGKEILIVGLLKGAILFVADLVRKLTVPSSINPNPRDSSSST